MIRAGNRCYNFSSIGALMDPAFLREAVGASGSVPWRSGPAARWPDARRSITWRRVRAFLAVLLLPRDRRRGGIEVIQHCGKGHLSRMSAP